MTSERSRMLLYHFTRLKNVAAIKKHGLLPHGSDAAPSPATKGMAGGRRVVWLCTSPTSRSTALERRLLATRCGVYCVTNRFLHPGSHAGLARFKVDVSMHDRKLKTYGPWLRRNQHRSFDSPDPDDRMMKRARETWWIYFGKIPTSRIVDCIIETAISK